MLQNLRTIDAAGFDTWYEPYQAEMRSDPLLRYFHRLRTELEKEGGAETDVEVYIEYLDVRDLASLLSNPPPGAFGDFFIGDSTGGSGWMVALPDGSTRKHYVQLPDSVRLQASWLLADAPKDHLGHPVEDNSALALSRLYLDYIGRLLTDAERRFG